MELDPLAPPTPGSRLSRALALLALAPAAQSVKLNAPLPGPSSYVLDCALDPTGTIALYVADQDLAGMFELYAVPLDQSAPPHKLNAPLPPNGDVTRSGNLPGFLVASTGAVVYRADPTIDEAFGLFVTTVDGSQTPVQLSGAAAAGRQVVTYALSDDGRWVTYVADQDSDDVYELYAVPTDASAPAHKVHTPLSDGDIFTSRIDPTGTKIVYVVKQSLPSGGLTLRLFSTPLDASAAPVLLATHTVSDFSQGVDLIEFSPDGAWVAYHLNYEVNYDPRYDLYLVPANGSLATRQLSGFTASGGLFTADGSRVVFSHSDFYHVTAQNLFSATMTGPVTGLESPQLGNLSWQLDPGSGTVFFVQESGVYRVPADGSAVETQLCALTNDSSSFLTISPDGSWLTFAARPTQQGTWSLHSVPTVGGPALLLNPLAANQSVWGLQFSPDSRFVGHLVQTDFYTKQLYLVPVDGSGVALRVNDPLPPGGSVLHRKWALAPDSVLYQASQEQSSKVELYKTPYEWKRWRRGPTGPLPPP